MTSPPYWRNLSYLVPAEMSPPALGLFETCLIGFARDLAGEASRLEFDARESALVATPEITSAMVDKANKSLRRDPQADAPLALGHLVLLQVVAPTLALLAGIFGSYLNSVWQWTAMIVFAVGFISTTVLGVIAIRRARQ